MQRYTGVICDLFGTLVPNHGAVAARGVLGAMAGRLRVGGEPFISMWQGAMWEGRATGRVRCAAECAAEILHVLGGAAPAAVFEEVGAVYRRFVQGGLVPYPGVVGTLSKIRERGVRVAVLTDCSTEGADHWEFAALAPVVDAAVFSCRAGFKKPHPRLFELAREAVGVEAGRARRSRRLNSWSKRSGPRPDTPA
jgi:putative hydrolase of the HAD superfamily